MANIGNDTFQHIYGAPDEATLVRILQFTQTGKQDESNNAARELIHRRLEELKAKRQAEEVQRQMAMEAQEYRGRQQGESDKMYASYEDQGRRALSARMSGITGNANKRGLLYSGLRQRSEQDALRDYSSGMAGVRVAANTAADDTAKALERRSVQAGLNVQRAASGQAQQAYDLDSDIRKNQTALQQSALEGIGRIGGTFLAKARG